MDFECTNHGSIVAMAPITPAARDWCLENLSSEVMMLGNFYAIEPRYFGAIVEGFTDDGLTSNVELRLAA